MKLPLITLALFAYACLRLVLPLPLGRGGKCAIGLALLLISQYYTLSRYVLGSLASPELPAPLLMIQGGLFIFLVVLCALLMAQDAFAAVFWLLRKAGAHAALPFSHSARALGLACAALFLASYGMWQAVRVPDVQNVDIRVPGLPAAFDGFTIAHITDLHASALLRWPRVKGITDKLNALQADLILMSGDLADGSTLARRDDVAPLASLRATHGVFSCPGNHEYYSHYQEWMLALDGLGVTMLENAHTVITVNGQSLVIAGTTDIASAGYGLPAPSLAAALAGAPANAPVILLEHRPGNARENAAAGVALQLAGHTHGGHITGMDRIVARFNNGFVSGLYDLAGMPLYVSKGAGLWNGFPVRIGVPSEITRITLRSPVAHGGAANGQTE